MCYIKYCSPILELEIIKNVSAFIVVWNSFESRDIAIFLELSRRK